MAGKTADIKEAQQQADERSRSTIKFPYGDLEDAVSVASAIWDKAGEECTRSQLAAYLNQTPTSGAYRLKLATASNFSLVKSAQGKVRLTDLGRAVVDPAKAKGARVRAFYAIPLYKSLYDRFDGGMLPPQAALERVIVELGVPPKQAEIARQVFQRSAQQAGFFEHGNNRLVEPSNKGGPPADQTKDKPRDPARGGGGSGSGSGSGELDPLILGMVNRLPQAGADWSADDQLKWLQTAAKIFGLLYGGTAEIEITLRRANDH